MSGELSIRVDPGQLADLQERIVQRLTEAPPSRTLAQFAEEWLPRKRKLASYVDVERRVRKHLLPFLGTETDATLKPKRVEEWLRQLESLESKRGRKLSAQSVRHTWDAGRQIVEFALTNEEWRGSNPFARVGPPHVEDKERESLTVDEAARALAAIHPLRVPLFAFAIYLGARRKELFNLRKGDVDRTAWTVQLPGAKTSKRRLVPIPDELKAHASLALALNPASEWLFQDLEGNQLTKNNKAGDVLRAGLAAAGIKKRLTFHDLRRVSSTLHQEAGCHPWVVSRILGHAQAGLMVAENMTARRYTRFSMDFARQELNRLSLKEASQ